MKSSFMFILFLTACQPSLEHQPKIGVLEEPRMPVAGTVTYAPKDAPLPKITRAALERGKDRYEIYCSVCHGLGGAGDGLATQRGLGAPKSFASENTLSPSLSVIETVIAKGKGRMNGFANRIPLADRYAIAAYTQVLKLRSHFPVNLLSETERLKLKRGEP